MRRHTVPRGHAATRLLPGTPIDVIGPLGQGFRLSAVGYALDHLLLIAGADELPWLQPPYQAGPAVAQSERHRHHRPVY